MYLPPLVELIYAARKIAGLNAHEALDTVPYSWLLRFRTQLWYLEGLGASPLYSDSQNVQPMRSFEQLMG